MNQGKKLAVLAAVVVIVIFVVIAFSNGAMQTAIQGGVDGIWNAVFSNGGIDAPPPPQLFN